MWGHLKGFQLKDEWLFFFIRWINFAMGGQRMNNEFFRRITTVTENIKTLYLKPTLENVLLSYTIKNIKLPLH